MSIAAAKPKSGEWQVPLLLLVLFALLWMTLRAPLAQSPPLAVRTLDFSARALSISVEIANTSATRGHGLIDRDLLNENSGMLFDMGASEQQTFWMYHTRIPLDAIFLDKSLRVVDIQGMVPCRETNPDNCTRYTSRVSAYYVLEVNGGFAKRHGIRIGDGAELR